MGTVHISVGDVNSRADTGATMPVRKSISKFSQTITTTASNQQATIVADQANNDFWRVVAKDADVWVAFGPNPNATTDPRELVTAGSALDVSSSAAGEKCAVVAA